MNKKELEKLRELANNATPGPWESDSYGLYIRAIKPESFPVADTNNDGEDSIVRIRGWGHLQYKGEETAIQIQKANGDYIAAANPQVILALLDQIEELQTNLLLSMD